MLILNPAVVTFGDEKFAHVAAVKVDRLTRKILTEWDDSGPHVRFCDCVQVEARVTVSVPLFTGDLSVPALGTQATLRATTGANASDAGRRVMRVDSAVLVSVRQEMTRASQRAAGAPAAMRELEFVCVSENGADPVQFFYAGAL